MIARVLLWWRRRRQQRILSTSARVRDYFKQISIERRVQVDDRQMFFPNQRFRRMREGLDVRINRAIPEPRIDREIGQRVRGRS